MLSEVDWLSIAKVTGTAILSIVGSAVTIYFNEGLIGSSAPPDPEKLEKLRAVLKSAAELGGKYPRAH